MKHVFANLFRVVALLLLLILLFRTEWLSFLLVPLTSNNAPAVYTQNSLPQLAASHLFLVAISIAGSAVLAILGGIFVTRKSGEDFLPLSRAIANAGQTFPPVAVLALAVPATGFGAGPTLIALFLYGLLPIFENTVSGLKQVSPSVLDAADGMGMNGRQRLFQVELPLALPLILEGLKVATVINIGTATIGSTVAAKGLGEVIIAGLISDNTAFILQGGLIVGLMAVLIYDAMGLVENAITQRIGLRPA
ncbi:MULTISPECIES: ABC transporter permease [unclassified Rhizobium]|uniref:ABC transporter permease n=1 Tax=unclassified Rhizobium TaxID=2613769 RepID=UPI000271A9B6|nr:MULTISPECIES: ABC transporter permease [unclassified Rhizobium]EJL49134.1 ABC-type proline/glycine betaine transport system, permease component [Rhizobium sp. CF122]MBB3398715.1 osmoprotectant transport system permease protein [Rhizobium sp. BK060]MBB4171393.1 osmoprotectant transport system permease protein [Rhizobium sp. BK538]TCM68896.1 osmoprotectant transport system permease protein [Rhizobium sp. BK068]